MTWWELLHVAPVETSIMWPALGSFGDVFHACPPKPLHLAMFLVQVVHGLLAGDDKKRLVLTQQALENIFLNCPHRLELIWLGGGLWKPWVGLAWGHTCHTSHTYRGLQNCCLKCGFVNCEPHIGRCSPNWGVASCCFFAN